LQKLLTEEFNVNISIPIGTLTCHTKKIPKEEMKMTKNIRKSKEIKITMRFN
jgi:hypothetical protein